MSAPAPNGPAASDPLAFLAEGGEMGRLIRSMDWSGTALGPAESWPQSLRTTVSLCLASNFPINIIWGPGRVQIYNDGYRSICGGNHPASMGQDFRECWESAWPAVSVVFAQALAGRAGSLEDQRMFLDRDGFLEETYFTYSFSPVRDETGGIVGLFHPVTETTGKVLSRRRARALRDLSARTSEAKSVAEALDLSARALAGYPLDLPFILLYALDPDGRQARLIATTGLKAGTAATPEAVDLDAVGRSRWPLHEAVRTRSAVQVYDAGLRLGPPPYVPYPEPPTTALVLPIIPPATGHPAAVLVAGVSSRLALNEAYRTFFDLLASGATAGVANARAYEEGRHLEIRSAPDRLGPREDAPRPWMVSAGASLGDGMVEKPYMDVSDRERAEAALRASEERLRLALAAARMGIWTWEFPVDRHVRDAHLNRLLGLEPVECTRPVADFFGRVHPDDRPVVRTEFYKAASRDRGFAAEFRVVWPDGSVRWLRAQGAIADAGGGACLAGACVDVTDLKEAEAALRRARDGLEHRVLERTAELAQVNEALREEMAARTELLRKLATAQEDERRRVARDLHDRLGQDLTALILGLKALEKAVPEDAPGRARLLEVEAIVGRIGREAHDLAIDLRPTVLDDLGLTPALSDYVARWAERTGVAADFQPTGLEGERLPPEVETTVYRVVQEALNNVAKHAGAGHVSVIVERGPGKLTALVEDDGRGFDPSRVGSGSGRRSLGLLGMRERVGLVGGTLLIESDEREGTTVRARIPLGRTAPEVGHGG